MNSNDKEFTFIYETEELSVSQWREVMLVCQAYEESLMDGQRFSPRDFALKYSEIPADILIPELERIHLEASEQSAPQSRSIEQASPESDRYIVLEEIQSGGMGHVYRAFDRTCGRLVALKRIRTEMAHDPEMKRRFLAEVELTADLEHPGVIPIYDQSVDSNGREFYVMRLIHGEGTGTLRQAIQAFHSMDPKTNPPGNNTLGSRSWNSGKRQAFRSLIESVWVITDTVAHAHSRGIAHRDLKPSNILVGPFGETLIADWGLAKRISNSEKSSEKLPANSTVNPESPLSSDISTNESSHSVGVGTPGFRAPEVQSSCSPTSLIAADIFSLGAILDCVITGSVRRIDELPMSKIHAHPSSSILPILAIARKAMSKDLAMRYPTAQALRMDLSNWLAGEPVAAYPESLFEKLWKWPTRHRITASSVASALLITLLGFAWFSWFQKAQNEILSQTLNTATVLLEENQDAKRSIEKSFAQREALALHAIIEFQSLLTLNPSLQSDPRFHTVREKILKESRSFYESLASSFDQSEKSDASLERLTDAALALVLLENEFGNFSNAIGIAESACKRLQSNVATSHRLEYQLGRMLAFKGNIQTRHGWKKQGQDDQESAMRHLEPLLDSSELTPKERINTALVWSRAASPFAISLAAKGESQSAKNLLEKILSELNELELQSFEVALLKIQSFGNLALVRYFSNDTQGAYESLEHAESIASTCEDSMDGSIPFREIVEFEVLKCTLVRFKSDLMLTEGKVEPAIALQNQSLARLKTAVMNYPGNTDIQNAYSSCATRLQAVLVENGRIAQANEVTQAWLDLAIEMHQADETNPNTKEFILLAYHTMGHFSEATQQLDPARQHYREALSIAESILIDKPLSERNLAQALELNVHLIRFELFSDDFQSAQNHFEKALEYASKLKSLPDKTDQNQSGINNQIQNALRFLMDSAHKNMSDQWTARLRESELLQ